MPLGSSRARITGSGDNDFGCCCNGGGGYGAIDGTCDGYGPDAGYSCWIRPLSRSSKPRVKLVLCPCVESEEYRAEYKEEEDQEEENLVERGERILNDGAETLCQC